MLCRIRIVQIHSRKHALDDADCTTLIRQHELDPADQEIYLSCLADLDLDHLDQLDHLDHLDHLDQLDHLDHLDHLDPNLPFWYVVHRICAVQVQSGKHALDDADCTTLIRQHELDHTDQESVCPERKYLYNKVGLERDEITSTNEGDCSIGDANHGFLINRSGDDRTWQIRH